MFVIVDDLVRESPRSPEECERMKKFFDQMIESFDGIGTIHIGQTTWHDDLIYRVFQGIDHANES